MDIGTIEGALKLRNEGSAVIQQFSRDAVTAAAEVARAAGVLGDGWEAAIARAKAATAGGFGQDLIKGVDQGVQEIGKLTAAAGDAAKAAETVGAAAAASAPGLNQAATAASNAAGGVQNLSGAIGGGGGSGGGGGGGGGVVGALGGFNSGLFGTIAAAQLTGQQIGQLIDMVVQLAAHLLGDLVRGLQESIKSAADFQTALTKMVTLAETSRASVDEIGQSLLDLAPKVGKGPQELAEAFYFVASAGIHGAAAMDIVTQSAESSAIGLGKTETIAHALVGVLNAYKDTGLTAAQANNIFIATVEQGNIEADQLAGTLGRVVGTAHSAGVSFQEVGTFIATFTRVGVDAYEAVTALRGTLSLLIKPAHQTREALDALGITADQLRAEVREKGLTAALLDLFDRLNQNKGAMDKFTEATGLNYDALGKILPNVRALSGFLATAGSQGKDFAEIQQKITAAMNDANFTTDRFKETQKNLQQQIAELRGEIEATKVKIGNEFIPALTEVVKAAKPAAAGLGELAVLLAKLTAQSFTISVQVVMTMSGLGQISSGAEMAKKVQDFVKQFTEQSKEPAIVPHNTSINLDSALGVNAEVQKNLKAAMGTVTDWTAVLRALDAEIAKLSDAQQENVIAGLKAGNSAKDLVGIYGLTEDAIKRLSATHKEDAKEANAAASEAAKAAEQFQQALDKMSGKEAINNAAELITQLDKLGSVKLIDPAQAQSMIDDLQAGSDAAARFGTVGDNSFKEVALSAQFYARQLQPIAASFKDQEDVSKTSLASVQKDIKGVSDQVGKWATEQDKLQKAINKANLDLLTAESARASKQFQAFIKDLDKTSDEIDQLKEESQGSTGELKKMYDQLIDIKQAHIDQLFDNAIRQVPEFRSVIIGLSTAFGGLTAIPGLFDKIGDGATKNSPKVKTLGQDLTQLAQSFATISQSAGESGLGTFTKAVGEIVSSSALAVTAFENVKKGIADIGSSVGSDLSGVFVNIATSIVSGFAALTQATDPQKSLGSRLLGGAATGAALGASFALLVAKGAAVAGVWGAAAGAIVGIFIAVFRGRATREAMAQVGREWGVSISEGLADTLKDEGKALVGGQVTADLLHMAEILKAAGGVTEDNFTTFLPKLHDVFSALQQGFITTAQATKVLNENFGQFASALLQTGKVAPQAFQDIIRLNKELGTDSQSIISFVSSQTAALGSSLGALIGPLAEIGQKAADRITTAQDAVNKLASDGKQGTSDWTAAVLELNNALAAQKQASVDNADQFARLGAITLAGFSAAVAGGLSVYQAMVQIGPAIDALTTAQQNLGIVSDNAALSELQHFKQLAGQNETLVASASALGDTLVALSTIGGLNIDTFKALEDQGVDTFHKLQAAGFTDQESLATIQGFLEKVIEAHETLGFPIDENTQALIDQAREYGLLKGDAHDAAQQMHDDLMGVVEAINNLARGLGVDVPNAAQQAAEAIGNIPTDITIRARVDTADIGSPDLPAFARGGIVRQPTVGLFGEAGPEAIVPLDQYDRKGGAPQTINLWLDGRLLTSIVVENMPSYIDLYGGNA